MVDRLVLRPSSSFSSFAVRTASDEKLDDSRKSLGTRLKIGRCSTEIVVLHVVLREIDYNYSKACVQI